MDTRKGGEEGVRVGRRGIVISLVFFIGKTIECLTCSASQFYRDNSVFDHVHDHLYRMLGSSLIANFLLAMNGPHRFITCFRGSPKVTLNLTH